MKQGGESGSRNSREIGEERIEGAFDQSIVVCVGNFYTTITSQGKMGEAAILFETTRSDELMFWFGFVVCFLLCTRIV